MVLLVCYSSFTVYYVVLAFGSVDDTLTYDHSNETTALHLPVALFLTQ